MSGSFSHRQRPTPRGPRCRACEHGSSPVGAPAWVSKSTQQVLPGTGRDAPAPPGRSGPHRLPHSLPAAPLQALPFWYPGGRGLGSRGWGRLLARGCPGGQAGGRAHRWQGRRGLAEGGPRGKARCLHHLTKDSPRLLPPPPCRRPRCIHVAGRPATALSSSLPKGSCHRRPLPQLLRTKASAHPPVAGPRGPAQGGRGGWAPIPAGTQPATGRGRLWPAHRGSGSKPQGGRAEAWSLDGGVQPGAGGGHRARMPREQRPAIPHGP